MRFFKIYLIIGLILVLGFAGYWLWRSLFYLDPQAPRTYYKIFNKTEILDGNEEKAIDVVAKLDRRLAKYQRVFEKMAGTTNNDKLRAFFMMNFVHFFGVYGKSNFEKKDFYSLLWESQYFDCGTYTMFLAMLLDQAGFEFRTVSINSGGHGYLEVKFDGQWQILDPTTNIWIDKSTEDQIAGAPRQIKKFFLSAEDLSNTLAREHFGKVKVNTIHLRDRYMSKISQGFEVKIDGYNYINLAEYSY